jgi:hypothetical protein
VTRGEKFDPENTVPAPAGSFVRRVARTPQYDGVKRDGMQPAVMMQQNKARVTMSYSA